MDKTFTCAGVSNLNGVVAYRFANDLSRAKVLAKNGHTDIKLVALERAMTKEEAIVALNAQMIFAEGLKVAVRASKPSKVKAEAPAVDDGFVEPKDERIQVAMSKLAKQYPGLSAQQLYDTVMLTHKEFGDFEPNF